MTRKPQSRIWISLLISNTIYWLWFWGYFFLHSTSAPKVMAWESASPFYALAGRTFGYEVPAVFHTLLIQSAFLLNIPCWVITYPVSHAMGGAQIGGTNSAGFRLILITLLSFGQWYVVAQLVERICGNLRNSRLSPLI